MSRQAQKLKAEENVIIKDSDPLRMKVWILPLRPAEMISEDEGNLEWRRERMSFSCGPKINCKVGCCSSFH